MKYVRERAGRFLTVDVPAEAFWKVLRAWSNIADYMPKENPPIAISSSRLKAGHSLDNLPCTREVVSPTKDGPILFEETLLHLDDETRTLYYRIEGVSLGGLRNYLAINEVDDLGDGRSHVRLHARYDLPSESSAEATRELLEDIYERGIISGIVQYIRARP